MNAEELTNTIYASDGFGLLQQYMKDKHAFKIMLVLFAGNGLEEFKGCFTLFNEFARNVQEELNDEQVREEGTEK